MSSDAWNPAQYKRFEQERSAPFFDLLELVEPRPGGRAVGRSTSMIAPGWEPTHTVESPTKGRRRGDGAQP